MPYLIKAQSARWVDPAEGYVLQDGESFSDEVPVFVAPALTKDQRIAEKLASRGLTLENEWLLYAGMAGILSAAAVQGKTEAQVYASNPGYKNAKDLQTAIAGIRAEA